MTAQRTAPIYSPSFYGDPTATTPDPGDDDQSIATTAFVADAIGALPTSEKALLLGRGGVITSAADCADFPFIVPFGVTLARMKVTAKAPPSGAMVVQLRRAAAPVTTPPTYSNVSGFVVTFTAGRIVGIVDPTNVAVDEGDVLNFSLSSADGQNVTVEVIAT